MEALSGLLHSAFTNALNGVTLYAQTVAGSGQTVKTTRYPDGGTRVETYYQDRSLLNVSGTAPYPLQYLYGVDSDGLYTTEIKVASGGSNNEWVKTSSDMLGRLYKTVFASASPPHPSALSSDVRTHSILLSL